MNKVNFVMKMENVLLCKRHCKENKKDMPQTGRKHLHKTYQRNRFPNYTKNPKNSKIRTKTDLKNGLMTLTDTSKEGNGSPLNNMSLNSTEPLICGFFFFNKYIGKIFGDYDNF